MLTFDEEKHLYRWNGSIVPSVTQIIHEWEHVGSFYINTFDPHVVVPQEAFEKRRDHGTAVHLAVKFELMGKLDWATLADEIGVSIAEFALWKAEYKPEIRLVEEKLYSSKYNFAGTIDLACTIDHRPAIVDIKTGNFDMGGPQTAAYELLDKENDKSRIKRRRYVLWLPPGGNYKFTPMTNPNDLAFFMARLTQYNYLKGR